MSEHHSITGEAVEAAVRESGQHLLKFSDDQQRHIICTCGEEISETDTHRIRAILAAAEPYMRRKWAEELLDEWSLGIGYSTLLNPKYGEHPATTFTRAVKYMIDRLEGAE
jgi:hypothetical protein